MYIKGRERNPLPCSRHLGQVWVTLPFATNVTGVKYNLAQVFSHKGEKSTPYRVNIRSTAASFWVLRQNLKQVARNWLAGGGGEWVGRGAQTNNSEKGTGLLYVILFYDVPGAPTARPDFQAASDQPNKADESVVNCSPGLSI